MKIKPSSKVPNCSVLPSFTLQQRRSRRLYPSPPTHPKSDFTPAEGQMCDPEDYQAPLSKTQSSAHNCVHLHSQTARRPNNTCWRCNCFSSIIRWVGRTKAGSACCPGFTGLSGEWKYLLSPGTDTDENKGCSAFTNPSRSCSAL